MSIREEQCNKVCRILDDVLANRPTERDSLIVAVRKAFEQLGNSEQLPSAQPESKEGRWVDGRCNKCGGRAPFWAMASTYYKSDFCPHCGTKMKGETT